MRSIDMKNIALKLKKENKSYAEIGSILGISRYVAKNLVTYKLKTNKRKTGTKHKITKSVALSIKREIANLRCAEEKINCSKLKKNCKLTMSVSTVQRHLKNQQLKYKNSFHEIVLSKKHKAGRLEVISQWITSNHTWETTVFSDEKRFSLDGPDCWMTYIPRQSKYVRNTRQCGGGGIMVWLMILPNGLLSFHMINGKFKAVDYVTLLDHFVVPIIKLNVKSNFSFQQDNCAVHTAKIVKEYMNSKNISTISWPSLSPDLNIVEDVWKIISDMVYDGPQFFNKEDLQRKIVDVICVINSTKRDVILDLYASIRKRLCKVLINKGNFYNA